MHLRHSSKLLLLLLIKFLCLTSFQMSYAEEPRADDVLYAELRANWNDIFPSGNRNAGGAMFFKYILDNYKDYNEFLSMNRFYCPVSGSFVPPDSEPEFVYANDIKTGKPTCGSLFRCCWPCACDIMRMAEIKKLPFEFKSGVVELHTLVIDNPCGKSSFPEEVLRDDFCEGEKINEHRVYSFDNKIVVGLLHDGFQCTLEQVAWIGLHRITGGQCSLRNMTPMDKLEAGMGDIFLNLAK